MITPVLDLWSDAIRVNVRTPLAILRIQENLLAKKTRDILRAQVVSINLGEHGVQHQLDLFAPALGYRETLLTAKHAESLVYPVTVTAKGLNSEIEVRTPYYPKEFGPSPTNDNELASDQKRAATEEEFVELVRQVLHSTKVRALIQSLIARSNELYPAEAPEENGLEAEATAPTGENEESH